MADPIIPVVPLARTPDQDAAILNAATAYVAAKADLDAKRTAHLVAHDAYHADEDVRHADIAAARTVMEAAQQALLDASAVNPPVADPNATVNANVFAK